MVFESERLKQLARAFVDAVRRQIALNNAYALKSADMRAKLTPEELEELRAAVNTTHATREALVDYPAGPPAAGAAVNPPRADR